VCIFFYLKIFLVMKYVLYEGNNGDILFTKEEYIKNNPSLLEPFQNKKPTFVVEATNDNEAILALNNYMNQKVV